MLSQIERHRAELEDALREADEVIAPAMAKVRACLFQLEEAMRPPFMARRVTVAQIIGVVAPIVDLLPADIRGKSQHKEIARARHAVVWTAREAAKHSYTNIGRALGDRDHSSIISSYRRACQIREHDEEFREWTDRLRFVFTVPEEKQP